MRAGFLTGICCLALFVCSPSVAQEQYPAKAMTIVVAYAPGGATDLAARVVASYLQKHLGQPAVVLNKAGGGTTIGGNAVATAKPDGYTLGFFTFTTSVPDPFSYLLKPPYSGKDLRAVSMVSDAVTTISVNSKSPWKSFKELIQHLKANPGTKYSVTSLGSHSHTLMVTIERAEKLKLTPVVCSGDAEIASSLLGEHTPFGLPHWGPIRTQVEAGNLRVLALDLPAKFPLLPGVPITSELGYRVPYPAFHGLFAPKGTPDTIVNKLDKAVEKMKDDPEFVEKFKALGFAVTYQSTDTFSNNLPRYQKNVEALFRELGYVK